METIHKGMKIQREIKKRILNDGGGIYTIYPKKINETGFLFMIEDTTISFFIENWNDFFQAKNLVGLRKSFTARLELINVSPKAIKVGEDSSLIGEARLLEVLESLNKIKN